MATYSSVLAWRIPGTGEPGGLPIYGVAQSQTRLKQLSSSSIHIHTYIHIFKDPITIPSVFNQSCSLALMKLSILRMVELVKSHLSARKWLI